MNAAEYLNQLDHEQARFKLEHCCASEAWIEMMLSARPFASQAELELAADKAADRLQTSDWLQAFAGHPRIGNVNTLRTQDASTKHWAAAEQSGVNAASQVCLQELKRCNELYYAKFGFIFIVYATGKSAEQMLEILCSRLPNEREVELRIAANEQRQITRSRLQKLVQ
ncbi:MAG: 2-oxo-4-hydroxy-4-carboxy-5-ureidoimidazoline decarboxylase [Pirellulaceae bacterium]|nr:2-oxo-4-hydroxy-4-carboxy-5-ureidoimidazoline decarboxylase [Pirellulaceae bacterium]